MKKIIFTKMSGTSNDFIIIHGKDNPGFKVNCEIVLKLCDRRNGIGADGVITIKDSEQHDFVMNYFNADGSTGSLCANGARCAILYVSGIKKLSKSEVKFLSNNVEYSGEFLADGMVKFYLNPPKKIKYNFKVKAANQLINAHFADTGSPHIVIKMDDPQNKFDFFDTLEYLPVEKLGREIRYLPEFKPDGTNVNFIKVSDSAIQIRSYERGVEAETMSCGTGSVAAALISYVTDGLQPPVKIITKENENLFVNFEVENQKVKNISLTGQAKIVFTGEIESIN
jgi:diaminopimelate epimerase